MPGYDSWKSRNPADGQYDPAMDEPPSREQEEADYLDEQQQQEVACHVCGGSGFSGRGSGYDDVCGECGGLRYFPAKKLS